MRRIAIIPARSGSKGLKDKNIIDLCGKPLLAYSIEAALESKLFERIILTTDSEKYAKIGKSYGAEIMMRGESLSNDQAITFMVIEDVLSRLGEDCDYFMLLQPTSPMRNSMHLTEASRLFEENCDSFDYLVSVKEAEHTAELVKPIGDDLSLRKFDADFSSYRRQNMKEYSPNGAIFIAKPKSYIKQKHFFGEKSIAYIMSKGDSIDIDDAVDYTIARALMQEKNR